MQINDNFPTKNQIIYIAQNNTLHKLGKTKNCTFQLSTITSHWYISIKSTWSPAWKSLALQIIPVSSYVSIQFIIFFRMPSWCSNHTSFLRHHPRVSPRGGDNLFHTILFQFLFQAPSAVLSNTSFFQTMVDINTYRARIGSSPSILRNITTRAISKWNQQATTEWEHENIRQVKGQKNCILFKKKKIQPQEINVCSQGLLYLQHPTSVSLPDDTSHCHFPNFRQSRCCHHPLLLLRTNHCDTCLGWYFHFSYFWTWEAKNTTISHHQISTSHKVLYFQSSPLTTPSAFCHVSTTFYNNTWTHTANNQSQPVMCLHMLLLGATLFVTILHLVFDKVPFQIIHNHYEKHDTAECQQIDITIAGCRCHCKQKESNFQAMPWPLSKPIPGKLLARCKILFSPSTQNHLQLLMWWINQKNFFFSSYFHLTRTLSDCKSLKGKFKDKGKQYTRCSKNWTPQISI